MKNPMRLLMVQNAVYVPAHGGANKGTRALMEGLAARGHACTAVVRASSLQGPGSADACAAALRARGIAPLRVDDEAIVFVHAGVEVHAVINVSRIRAYVGRTLSAVEPDWTIVASEDPMQVLLEACLPRVVYFAQTTLVLPFGPGSFMPVPRSAELIRRAAGVLVISEYLRGYFQRWVGIDPVVLRPPHFGPPPYPILANRDSGYVTFVNPCTYKGLPIFLELAARLPDVAFAVVPSWGTTRADAEAVARLPNVRVLEPVDDVRELFAKTSVLLMPSLWSEAGGYTVAEAMLHGIPVVASDAGGLPEAKLGVDYVVPVNAIERYGQRSDERGNPLAIVPPQNVEPWERAVRDLLSDAAHYRRVSEASRAAALRVAETASVVPFEDYFEGLSPFVVSGGHGTGVDCRP